MRLRPLCHLAPLKKCYPKGPFILQKKRPAARSGLAQISWLGLMGLGLWGQSLQCRYSELCWSLGSETLWGGRLSELRLQTKCNIHSVTSSPARRAPWACDSWPWLWDTVSGLFIACRRTLSDWEAHMLLTFGACFPYFTQGLTVKCIQTPNSQAPTYL